MIRQFLRIEDKDFDLDKPYTKIILPDGKAVNKVSDITGICLILLKKNQKYNKLS